MISFLCAVAIISVATAIAYCVHEATHNHVAALAAWVAAVVVLLGLPGQVALSAASHADESGGAILTAFGKSNATWAGFIVGLILGVLAGKKISEA